MNKGNVYSFQDIVNMVADWRVYLAIPDNIKVGVQVGDVSAFSADAGHGEDGLAFTMGSPDNTEFEVCFDPRALERDDILQIVVHELVHVWSFSQCGEDPRENMEAVTDELARLVRERRGYEAALAAVKELTTIPLHARSTMMPDDVKGGYPLLAIDPDALNRALALAENKS